MTGSRRHALRIVVQRRNHPQGACYRLVAYGDAASYKPLEFAARAELFHVLRMMILDLDEAGLIAADDAGGNHIIFTDDVTVSESQLRESGLLRNG